MRKGIIITNAYSTLPSSLNQSLRLKDELAALGVAADICPNRTFPVEISGDGEAASRLAGYDFCIYLDKDKYVSVLLEKTGMRLFNSAEAIATCDDKMLTHIALSGHGIQMPKTLPGLLCYDPQEPVQESTLAHIEQVLGYPVIIKASYGSLGKDVRKADNRQELYALAEQYKLVPHLFQECIQECAGRDIRVIVIGGKAVAAMQRESRTDFRSNIELGGKGSVYELDPDLSLLCGKVSGILGLDYCGIDVLPSSRGYLVCEVNSNAFFGGIEAVTGTNIARLYAEYIVRKVYG
ncbi:MAG: RimK family alpha-L-glutamate ligase [Clostridia bacterium]|nr:RimK family alpha-L-glutamate ligase [Clostridia bacterium]